MKRVSKFTGIVYRKDETVQFDGKDYQYIKMVKGKQMFKPIPDNGQRFILIDDKLQSK